MYDADYWIGRLELTPHREGGYYREVFRAALEFPRDILPRRYEGPRVAATSIYFLLRAGAPSYFHRIRSDEVWNYHSGGAATIHILTEEGGLIRHTIGPDPEQGHSLQVVVPACHWFATMVDEGYDYLLAGCTVAPGFDYSDFELASRETLVERFPQHAELFERLALEDPKR